MKKQPLIFLSIILALIAGCASSKITPANNRKSESDIITEPKQKDSYCLGEEIEPSKNIASKEIDKLKRAITQLQQERQTLEAKLQRELDIIEKKHLKNQLEIQKDFADKISEYEKKAAGTLIYINWISGIICVIIAIFGILGFISFKDSFSSSIELRRYVDEILKTYQLIREDIKERQLELKEHVGFEGRKHDVSISPMEISKFLDYEHRIYFMLTNLPITRDLEPYKESLYKLGIYWWWRGEHARAILRFEEIEKIHYKIETTKKGLIRRIKMYLSNLIPQKNKLIDIRKGEGLILGEITHHFYNYYGNACLGYAKQCENPEEKREYLNRAETYYNTSKEICPHYSRPYYNLGILYVLQKNQIEKGIQYYNQVLGKTPNIDLATRRNIACALKKRDGRPLSEIISEIINVLEPIPENEPYWQEIFRDEVLLPLYEVQEWKDFINRKFPQFQPPAANPSSQ